MTMLNRFFQDRRGIGTIDYCFLAALTIGVRDLGETYGRAAGFAIKQAFGIA